MPNMMETASVLIESWIAWMILFSFSTRIRRSVRTKRRVRSVRPNLNVLSPLASTSASSENTTVVQ